MTKKALNQSGTTGRLANTPGKKGTSAKDQVSEKKKRSADASSGSPAFPYTTEPQALKRLLVEIPRRPKPPKMNLETLKGWKVSSSNGASTVLRVMKQIGLLQDSLVPTDQYAAFMLPATGSAALGHLLRQAYRVLFENSLAPQTAPSDELKTLFNVHSGGGEDAMRLQIQTFKILADFASFTGEKTSQAAAPNMDGAQIGTETNGSNLPPIQVDLHIHLPENKSTRDYEAIIPRHSKIHLWTRCQPILALQRKLWVAPQHWRTL